MKNVTLITSTFLLIIVFCSFELTAQNEVSKTEFRGYVKDLRTISFFDSGKNIVMNNILHSRMDFRYFPNNNVTFKASIRNQLHYGAWAKAYNNTITLNQSLVDLNNSIFPEQRIPETYGAFLEDDEALLDLKHVFHDELSSASFVELDRLYLDFSKGKWQVRIGKQRVNWGINWVWNPLDIFNIYSYIDFDYEERPGTDALRLQYFPNYSSSLEITGAPGQSFEESTIGFKYQMNKSNTDYTFSTGLFQDKAFLGFGFAGAINNTGVKGEMIALTEDQEIDEKGIMVALGSDYGFRNGLFIQGELLYNSFGQNEANNLSALTTGQLNLSLRTISSFEWSVFGGANYPISPLLYAGLGILYFPQGDSFLAVPSITYSLCENLDMFFIAQITELQKLDPSLPFDYSEYGDLRTTANIRIKWSW